MEVMLASVSVAAAVAKEGIGAGKDPTSIAAACICPPRRGGEG